MQRPRQFGRKNMPARLDMTSLGKIYHDHGFLERREGGCRHAHRGPGRRATALVSLSPNVLIQRRMIS